MVAWGVYPRYPFHGEHQALGDGQGLLLLRDDLVDPLVPEALKLRGHGHAPLFALRAVRTSNLACRHRLHRAVLDHLAEQRQVDVLALSPLTT